MTDSYFLSKKVIEDFNFAVYKQNINNDFLKEDSSWKPKEVSLDEVRYWLRNFYRIGDYKKRFNGDNDPDTSKESIEVFLDKYRFLNKKYVLINSGTEYYLKISCNSYFRGDTMTSQSQLGTKYIKLIMEKGVPAKVNKQRVFAQLDANIDIISLQLYKHMKRNENFSFIYFLKVVYTHGNFIPVTTINGLGNINIQNVKGRSGRDSFYSFINKLDLFYSQNDSTEISETYLKSFSSSKECWFDLFDDFDDFIKRNYLSMYKRDNDNLYKLPNLKSTLNMENLFGLLVFQIIERNIQLKTVK